VVKLGPHPSYIISDKISLGYSARTLHFPLSLSRSDDTIMNDFMVMDWIAGGVLTTVAFASLPTVSQSNALQPLITFYTGSFKAIISYKHCPSFKSFIRTVSLAQKASVTCNNYDSYRSCYATSLRLSAKMATIER
jgi:hypothetical protein